MNIYHNLLLWREGLFRVPHKVSSQELGKQPLRHSRQAILRRSISNAVIMKVHLVTLLVLFGLFPVYALTYGQQVTLVAKQASLESLLHDIEKQADYKFLYKEHDIKNVQQITVNLKNVPVRDALNEILKDSKLRFEIFEKSVVLKKALAGSAAIHSTEESTLSEANRSSGQQVLSGQVLNEKGNPMAGVSIQAKRKSGHSFITQTDEKGNFSFPSIHGLSAQESIALIFTYIGYHDFKMDVKADFAGPLNVKMVPEDQTVEEVVVTGYTDIKKETFTGAATTITRKQLEKYNNNNIFSILQTLDPAFKIDQGVQSGSNPNVIPEINIRGVATVGGYLVNAPLVVIDGFESSLQILYDMDINRIESITILKDASSTSLYGSRGSNGVLAIETRLPKAGKFTINYSARPSVTVVDLSDYNLMNASEKLEYELLAGVYDANKSSFLESDERVLDQEYLDNLYAYRLNNVKSGVESYWLYQPVQSTTSINHSLRMEGGSGDTRYSLTGDYNDFKGIIKGSGRIQGGASFNLNYRLRDKITFNNIASYQYSKAYNSPYGDFSIYGQMNPYERIYEDDGTYTTILSGQSGFYSGGETIYNPLYNTSLGFRDDDRNYSISNNAALDWFVSPEFRIRARGMLSRSTNDSDMYISPFHTVYFTINEKEQKGSYSVKTSSSTQVSGNVTLQYSKSLGQHVFNTNVMGEIRSGRSTSNSYQVTGFTDDRFISPSIALRYPENSLPISSDAPRNAVGFLGSLFYTFNNRYVVSGTYRTDASSLYGKQNRFGYFWSTGLAYNIHREPWFQNKYVNWLRLRANIGTNGSESFNADMIRTAYRFISGKYYYNQYSASYTSQGNPSVKWPVVRQLSLGAEMGIFNDLVSLGFSFYDKTTKDMISTITVAPSFGFAGNTYYQNLGKVNNRGYELTTNFRLLQSERQDFSWYMAVGAAYNRSKLLEISHQLRQLNESLVVKDNKGRIIKPSSYYDEGESLTNIRGVRSLGIDPASGREMFLDRDNDITYTWDERNQVVIGNSEPKVFGNLSTTFNYKRFSVQVATNYSLGGDVYNQTLVNKVENNDPLVNADKRVLQERWQKPGDKALYKALQDQGITQVSSRFVQKENYLRITSLNINYDVPSQIITKYKILRLGLNFSMNDMFRFSTVRMERGLDYPYARTYNFGITASL